MAPVRLSCLVRFCKHTRGKRKCDAQELVPGAPWICGQHWRHVSRQKKRRWTKLGKLWDKAVAKSRPKAVKRLRRIYWQAWDDIVREAIEAAVGIA